jgi:Putative transposase
MVVSTRKNRWFVTCEPPSDAAIAAVSLERLTEDDNGDLVYMFTRPRSDGTTGIKLSPLELLEKPAAIVPLAGTSLKDTLGDRYCGKNVRPTGIESQVCEDLRGLRFRQAIIHRPLEVIRDLRDLA